MSIMHPVARFTAFLILLIVTASTDCLEAGFIFMPSCQQPTSARHDNGSSRCIIPTPTTANCCESTTGTAPGFCVAVPSFSFSCFI